MGADMKVKIFAGDDTRKLENEINKWLDKNKVNILPLQSETGDPDYWAVTITIFYNEEDTNGTNSK